MALLKVARDERSVAKGVRGGRIVAGSRGCGWRGSSVCGHGGGNSRQWKASSGTLLGQCRKVRADVLLLSWKEGVAYFFCLLPIRDLTPQGRKILSSPGGLLKRKPGYLAKGWVFGKTATVAGRGGLLNAVNRVFRKHASDD